MYVKLYKQRLELLKAMAQSSVPMDRRSSHDIAPGSVARQLRLRDQSTTRTADEEKAESDLYRLEADLDIHQILLFREFAERSLLEEIESLQATQSEPIPILPDLNLPSNLGHSLTDSAIEGPVAEGRGIDPEPLDQNQPPIILLEPSTPPRSMTSASLASDSETGLHPELNNPSSPAPMDRRATSSAALAPPIDSVSPSISTGDQPASSSSASSNQHQSWLAWGLHGVYSGLFGGQSTRPSSKESSVASSSAPLRPPNASEMDALYTILKPPSESTRQPPPPPSSSRSSIKALPSIPVPDPQLAKITLHVSRSGWFLFFQTISYHFFSSFRLLRPRSFSATMFKMKICQG